MTHVDDIIFQIKNKITSKKWSKRKLAMAAGLHERALQKINEKSFNPCKETLVKLEKFLEKHK